VISYYPVMDDVDGSSATVYIRIRPTLNAPIVATVTTGDMLGLVGHGNGDAVTRKTTSTLWDYVRYNGQDGWIADNWLDTGTSQPLGPSVTP